jgi:hypothetical protein
MRWPTIGVFPLWFLFTLLAPPGGEALTVEFCAPSCGTAQATVSPGARVGAPPNVVTTTVNLATSTAPRRITAGTQVFTITPTSVTTPARAIAQQSATLQRITFTNTTITATGCSQTAPCTLEIRATSVPDDFPTPKPTGGYPATAFMSGFFTGPQVGSNGDTISMTVRASGLSGATVLNQDVVNATPGGAAADQPRSLPASCTGNPTCLFKATTALRSFNTQISETVQQKCATGATKCQTQLQTSVNLSIKTSGNRVSLPAGFVTVDPSDPTLPSDDPHSTPRDQIGSLISESLPPFDTLDVRHLLVHGNSFALDLTFALDPELRGGSTVFTPVDKEVFLQIGSFAMTIPPGKFRSSLGGKLFTFLGKVDGREIAATFVRHSNRAVWTFAAAMSSVSLADLPFAPDQVSVDFAVGSDTGSALVTPARF